MRFLILLIALVPYAPAQFVAVLSPGVKIQSIVDGFPAGTIFFMMPGIYRQQTIVPKHRNQFLGLPGAVLSGARLLNPSREGQYWAPAKAAFPIAGFATIFI